MARRETFRREIEAGKKDQAKTEFSKALKLDSNLKNRADVQKAMATLAI